MGLSHLIMRVSSNWFSIVSHLAFFLLSGFSIMAIAAFPTDFRVYGTKIFFIHLAEQRLELERHSLPWVSHQAARSGQFTLGSDTVQKSKSTS